MHRSISASLLAVGLLADLSAALKVLPLAISKPLPADGLRFRKRAYSESLANNVTEGSYVATVSVGTPAQTIQVAIDTGSSDVWFNSVSANLCTSQRLQDEYGPCITPFDSSKSSSFKDISKGTFVAQYADQSGASGDYFTDTFSVGGATINTFQMGLASKTTNAMGLMGVGFDTNEATSGTGNTTYPNLVDSLVAAGLIRSKAYSLWLNDVNSQSGTVLFGGVDTDKYIGKLGAVPIEPTDGQYVDFTVALSKVSSSGGQSNTFSTSATPVVLDSGTTLMYLPSSIVTAIYKQLNVYDDTQNSGLALVNCQLLTSDTKTTIDFQFGGDSGPSVSVPLAELIQNDVQQYVGVAGGFSPPADLPFPADQACSFGVQEGQDLYLLGDSFLRSAYVVYDLDNHQIAIGQANLNSSSSNVVEIGASSSGIPEVTGVASQVTVAASVTGLPGAGRQTGTVTGTGVGGGSGGSGGGQATVTITTGGSGASATSKSAVAMRPAPFAFEAVGVAAVVGLFTVVGGALMVL